MLSTLQMNPQVNPSTKFNSVFCPLLVILVRNRGKYLSLIYLQVMEKSINEDNTARTLMKKQTKAAVEGYQTADTQDNVFTQHQPLI